MARHGRRREIFWNKEGKDYGVFVGIEHRQKGEEAHQQETSWPRKDTQLQRQTRAAQTGPRGELCTVRRCGDGCQRDSLVPCLVGGSSSFSRCTSGTQKVGLCDTKHFWKRS